MTIKIDTPRGSIVRMKNGSARLEWRPDFQAEWQWRYNRAQEFVDSEILRLSAPYTPMQTSMLQKSGILGTIPGTGEVVWLAPYARFQYYGKVMVGAIYGSTWAGLGEPKILTDKNLIYHGAPKRGAFWFERMKADHKHEIVDGAARIAGGR